MTLASTPEYDPERVSRHGTHAIVIGAGMAGIMASRVLVDAFDRVTVLERDGGRPHPNAPGRAGAPQSEHVHVLLEAGRVILDDLFPGFSSSVEAAGGLNIDGAEWIKHYDKGGFLAKSPDPLPMLSATRPLFERIARRRIARHPRITIESGHRAVGIPIDDGEVTGVTVRRNGAASEHRPATLVVDASGRTSRVPRWLEQQGISAPQVDEVRVDVSYGTTQVPRPSGVCDGYLIPPSAPRSRGAAVVPVEGDKWAVTLIGVHGVEAPTDPEGYREFARSLPTAAVADLLAEHDLREEDVKRYRFPSNRRHRYEQLDDFPAGLAVVGDGLASFNPIYGQGISVAAMSVMHLHAVLADRPTTALGRALFERLAPTIDTVWRLSVGADFAFDATTGPKPPLTGLMNRYVDAVLRAAKRDGWVADRFYRVLRLEESPRTLFVPRVLGRVLLYGNRFTTS